jgi:hypothetical protein
MTQHFTRSTTQVLAYCNRCGRRTMHRVDDRRIGPCLEHGASGMTKKQEALQKRLKDEAEQPGLFTGYK